VRSKQIIKSITIGVFVLLAAICQAEPELTPYLSFTVPGLDGAIEKIELADIDGDNIAEVLATDRANLALYSVTDDELWLELSIDSFYAANGYGDCSIQDSYYTPVFGIPQSHGGPLKILLADVNRDDRTDAILLTRNYCGLWASESTYLVLFVDDVASSNLPLVALELQLESALGIGMLGTIGLGGDGHDNLILSVDSSIWLENAYSFSAYSYGKTLFFHSFPDSLSLSTPKLYSTFQVLPSVQQKRYLATATSYSWVDYMGIGPQEYWRKYFLIQSDIDSVVLTTSESSDWNCSMNHDVLRVNILAVQLIRAVEGGDPSMEIIATLNWRQRCDVDFPDAEDSTGSTLIAYQYPEVDSISECWRVDTHGQTLDHFIAHPSFPDQFFAMAGDTLMRFSTTDGSLLRRYDELPEGMKSWDYPYGGDTPYLVIVNHDTVSYYGFDIVTEVETNDNETLLPTNFTLGQPYPNPFNPTVTLPIALNEKGHLTVEAFNPLGQQVATIYDAVTSAGVFDLTWDASEFASGVYLFRATTENQTASVKAVLLK